jgi:hypothetical protein
VHVSLAVVKMFGVCSALPTKAEVFLMYISQDACSSELFIHATYRYTRGVNWAYPQLGANASARPISYLSNCQLSALQYKEDSTSVLRNQTGHCFLRLNVIYFILWLDSLIWAWASSFSRDFMVTHFRHTTLGRTPLDEGPARRRDLYLTTHNTHKRQTYMP